MAQQGEARQSSAHESGPERQCALTRERRARGDLLRFVLDPSGRVVPDLKNRLPGRGVWLTATRDAVARAAKKGVFPRGFSGPVAVDPDLEELVEALLEKAALERLSLANKAGLVTSGFEKVAEAIGRKRVVVLLHAADSSPGGRAKLDGKAAGLPHSPLLCFTSEQLSLALGRSNVVHAAVSKGGAAENFLGAADRLVQYRGPAAVRDAGAGPFTDTV